MAELETVIELGSTVMIDRDEKRYPSQGSWPRHRGNFGTIVQINHRDAEYGVTFGYCKLQLDGNFSYNSCSWFKLHELRPVEVVEPTP